MKNRLTAFCMSQHGRICPSVAPSSAKIWFSSESYTANFGFENLNFFWTLPKWRPSASATLNVYKIKVKIKYQLLNWKKVNDSYIYYYDTYISSKTWTNITETKAGDTRSCYESYNIPLRAKDTKMKGSTWTFEPWHFTRDFFANDI